MRIKEIQVIMAIVMMVLLGMVTFGGDRAYAVLSPTAQQTYNAVAASISNKIIYADISNNDTEHNIEISFYDQVNYLDNIAVMDGTSLLPQTAYSLTYGRDAMTNNYNGWLYVTIRFGILTAGNHNIQLTYRGNSLMNVNQPILSNNAKLSNLSLSSGNLNEAFDAGTTNYTQSAGSGMNSLTVTPAVSDPLASVSIQANNGEYAAVASGQASGAISLMNGMNVIRVKVTAQTGISNTYEITVMRPASITKSAITGVTAPVTGATPAATIAATTEYTAAIVWSPAAATFAENTAYTATITITPKAGFNLSSVPANFFTVAGATATNAAGSGVVRAVTPATAAKAAVPISTPTIKGVQAPVAGETPVETIAATTEYTATIAWTPISPTLDFDEETVYRAKIKIKPKQGYTLAGVPQNFFKVAGATTTNAAGSGDVTGVFAATGLRLQAVEIGLPFITPPVVGQPIVNTYDNDYEIGIRTIVNWYPSGERFEGGTRYVAYVGIYRIKEGRNLAASYSGFYDAESGIYSLYDPYLQQIAVYFPETDRVIEKQTLALPAPRAGQRGFKQIVTEEYTANIKWSPDVDIFNADTQYTARVKITPNPGHLFPNKNRPELLLQNDHISIPGVIGAPTWFFSDTNTYETEVLFPATNHYVPGVDFSLKVGFPLIESYSGNNYSAAISWSPATGIFMPDISYSANISITPDPGFTLWGIDSKPFNIPGAHIISAFPLDFGDAFGAVIRAQYAAIPSNPIISPIITGVTAPAIGTTPVSTITATTEYTAAIAWSPAAATFSASTAYTATITITPKAGYTLMGVAQNFFKVAGATTTNAAGSGVATAVFPATGTAYIASPIIAGVTAPATGATPVSTIAATAEYTAAIAWSPAAATFAESTIYTATLTITPRAGYTLAGVGANFFTVTGAITTNAAGSGVVTAVFPATPVLTGLAAVNAATSAAAVQVLLESDVIQTELDLTMSDYSDLTAAIRLGIAAAVFNGGTDYTSAAEIKAAFDAAVMDAKITILPVVAALRAAAGNVAAVQAILEMNHSELGLTMDDYNNLSSVSKTAVAALMLNWLFDTVAVIEAIFDAEVTAQPVVAAINEAISVVQVQSLLDIPALGLEFMDYYSALDDPGKLIVATAIFDGKLYTTSDSLEEVFNQEVFIQKMINDMNIAATTDEMIDLLIINQNLLELNLNTFDGRTAVAAAMMIRRPYSTAAEIKAAFIADFTAQIVATINLATSADEVQSILFVHFADIGILNIGSKKYYQFDYNARLDIAAYVFNDGANYANVASIKARFDEIATNYLP